MSASAADVYELREKMEPLYLNFAKSVAKSIVLAILSDFPEPTIRNTILTIHERSTGKVIYRRPRITTQIALDEARAEIHADLNSLSAAEFFAKYSVK